MDLVGGLTCKIKRETNKEGSSTLKKKEYLSLIESDSSEEEESFYNLVSSIKEESLDPKNKDQKYKAERDLKNKMYKTELCRNFSELGFCKYGIKCQFAHDTLELRDAERHPRYKTEYCKNYLKEGECKYGRRCCFLHINKETGKEEEYTLCEDNETQNEEKIALSDKISLSEKSEEKEDSSFFGGSIWNNRPFFYVEMRHSKFYEASEYFRAPGEPCLPFRDVNL